MRLFKTKYNDVEKAIKSLENGGDYDIDKASLEILENDLFWCRCVDRFGIEILDKLDLYSRKEVFHYAVDKFGTDILEKIQGKKYRSEIFSYAIDKFGIEILDKFGEWIWADPNIVGSVYKKNSSLAMAKASVDAMTNVLKYDNEKLFWYIFDKIDHDSKYFLFTLNGYYMDTPKYSWFYKKYKSCSSWLANCTDVEARLLDVMNAFSSDVHGSKSSVPQKIFLSEINMMFVVFGGRRMIGFPVDDLVKNNKHNITDYLNISSPPFMLLGDDYKPDFNSFNFENWLQPKHKQKKLDDQYVRAIIIPFVDNLLLGNKIAISAYKKDFYSSVREEKLIDEIIQDGLSSMPSDKANCYSFCSSMKSVFATKILQNIQIIGCTSEKDIEKAKTANMVILNAEKGCEEYIPQTEYAKQMLAKLSKNETKQTVEEVIEQPKSNPKGKDHELS